MKYKYFNYYAIFTGLYKYLRIKKIQVRLKRKIDTGGFVGDHGKQKPCKTHHPNI